LCGPAARDVQRQGTMPYRMIAIDLDGTLLASDGSVPQRAKAAIHSALGAGLLVCFATGRNWTESRSILDTVAHHATAVFVSGAMVMDTRHEVTLHRTMMAPDLAREVCAVLEELGHSALALQDTHKTGGIDYLATAGKAPNEAERLWREVTQTVVQEVPSLATWPHDHTIRIGIVAPPQEVAEALRQLTDRFGERIVSHSIRVPAYGVDVMEVFDPAVNKWQGILHVARMHGVAEHEIVAIGDDVNDLPMIRQAGLGVAMGNARDEVKAVAQRVIGRNDEDGLATFLEQLVAEHTVVPAPQ
jgi:Cof subfamily protein (haloacid dehalogenase superfamily)